MDTEKTLKAYKKVTFKQFAAQFPAIKLPVVLSEDTHHLFSQQNTPIPEVMINKFIEPIEGVDEDELTEYVACFRLPDTGPLTAIVYWKAGLLNYEYVLATFDKKGDFVDKRVIAGTFSDDEVLTQSVAQIKEDLSIIITSGQSELAQSDFDASSSTAYVLQLQLDGHIVNE